MTTPSPTLTGGSKGAFVGARILVIDDEASLLKLLQKLLSRHGAVVLTAASGQDATAMVAQHRFDLLICDYNLSDGKATALLPILLAAQPDVRVLVCSGEPVEHPGCGFLAKPFCAEDLVLAVTEILKR